MRKVAREGMGSKSRTYGSSTANKDCLVF